MYLRVEVKLDKSLVITQSVIAILLYTPTQLTPRVGLTFAFSLAHDIHTVAVDLVQTPYSKSLVAQRPYFLHFECKPIFLAAYAF